MLRPYSMARVASRRRSGRSEVDRRQAASGLQWPAASRPSRLLRATAGSVAPPTGAGGRYGLPRAVGPGLTYPVGRTATERAALKRPCSARLTSRSPRPALGHAPAPGVTPHGRAGWVNPGAVPRGSEEVVVGRWSGHSEVDRRQAASG